LLISQSGHAALTPLTLPSMMSDKAANSLLLDVALAGNRLVAVGERGHILYSDDQGRSWTQAQVPVSSTLTAVSFPSPEKGWAVGHEGVVLHSKDGGRSWVKQLDGFQANQSMLESARRWVDAQQREPQPSAQETERLDYLLQDAEFAAEEGASKPFLDVWFNNEREGFVIGAYGMIFYTSDGGGTWRPWQINIENRDGFHYNAITRVGGALFIAGEAGLLARSIDGGMHWQRLESPYEGSYFGIIGSDSSDYVIAFGLRGNAFRSLDQGNSWSPLTTYVESSLSGGASLTDGAAVLVSNSGALLYSNSRGENLRFWEHPDPSPYNAVIQASDQAVVLVGQGGVRRLSLANAE
jgi:photosystem II stability/assembly factor-like uncharacterized protein